MRFDVDRDDLAELTVFDGFYVVYPADIHEFDLSSCFVPVWQIDEHGDRVAFLEAAADAAGDDPWAAPCNNDLGPSGSAAGDYDILSYAEQAAELDEIHVALMGGWCARHPNRPPETRPVAGYLPDRQES